MRSLPCEFCEACARQLGDGKPIAVRTDRDFDHPGAACCPHILAEYKRLDERQQNLFGRALS